MVPPKAREKAVCRVSVCLGLMLGGVYDDCLGDVEGEGGIVAGDVMKTNPVYPNPHGAFKGVFSLNYMAGSATSPAEFFGIIYAPTRQG